MPSLTLGAVLFASTALAGPPLPPRLADLTVTQAGPASVTRPAPGAPETLVTYTMQVSNIGRAAAQSVSFVDAMPSPFAYRSSSLRACIPVGAKNVRCALGILPPGASVQFTLTFAVLPASLPCTPIIETNTVRVSTSSPESVYTNNQDIKAIKVGCPAPAATLTIEVKNTGSTDIAVRNERNINLLRFDAHANEDVMISQAVFTAKVGSLLNARNYMLWVDTDGNDLVDTILQSDVAAQYGFVTFDALAGGGYVVPADADKDTVTFEVHADIAASFTDDPRLQLEFATAEMNYVAAEEADDGTPLIGISTDGACDERADFCQIFVTTIPSIRWDLVDQGNLYITPESPLSSPPFDPSRQLLGGEFGESVLRVELTAQYEGIDIFGFDVTGIDPTNGNTMNLLRSVERFELFRTFPAGQTIPFATATVAACGPNIVNTFCANMESQQFVLLKNETIDIFIRPRMKSDVDGGMRNDFFALRISGQASADNETGESAVQARGYSSSINLLENDGDSTAEGEVFIGIHPAGPNSDIVGNRNQTVLSKIVRIENTDPNADGSNVPVGMGKRIAEYRFTAAVNNNTLNGRNKAAPSDLIFTIDSKNVEIAAVGFTLHNKADATVKVPCTAKNSDGSTFPPSGTIITSIYYVECSNLNNTALDIAIDSGDAKTFVLEANILNPQYVGSLPSSLQVSFDNFNAIEKNGTFGVAESHVQWLDMDTDGSAYQWIEYPESIIKGTFYDR